MQQENIQNSNHTLNAKSIAKYALLPGYLPRLGRLARHFSEFMFVFTQLFGTLGLIEKNHPCLQAENIGMYRFTDIVSLAISNLRWNRQSIPQIVMFFAVMLSLALMVAIIGLVVVNILMTAGTAHAQFFGTPTGSGYSANDDWAMKFLVRIFGMQDFFAPGVPTPGGNAWFTALLGAMLQHYSMAMLIVAAFMVLYLLVITMTEAANTGKPFGTRFDSIWAPIRIALAIGLLIPVTTSGYNGAQMLVLQSAKWGSNLASNAWMAAIKGLDNPNFLSASMSDPGYRFVRDVFLINLCVQMLNEQRTQVQQVDGVGPVEYFIADSDEFITVSFGPRVAPDFCGQVKYLKKLEHVPQGLNSGSWPVYTSNQYQKIAETFMPVASTSVKNGVATVPAVFSDFVTPMAQRMAPASNDKEFPKHAAEVAPDGAKKILGWLQKYWTPLGRTVNLDTGATTPFFSNAPYSSSSITSGTSSSGAGAAATGGKLGEFNNWIVSNLMQDAKYGWTTAGVFYLRMSSAMSLINKIVNNPPRVTIMPSNLAKPYATMDSPRANTEKLRDFCNNFLVKGLQIFDVFGLLGKDKCARIKLSARVNDTLLAGVTWFSSSVKSKSDVYSALGGETFDRLVDLPEPDSSSNQELGNALGAVVESVISVFVGGDMRIADNDLHPLGKVISWGFGMLQSSVVAFAAAIILPGSLGSIAQTIAMVLIVPGFMLAFWVPMQPFLYFTFAVIEWMISVLEAVIGMPLWALSLISLEGDGLGKGMEGVKRVFEIILRPTIIVLSLLASVLIFTAAISFFNSAMQLYASGYADATSDSGNFFTSAGATVGMLLVYMFGIYSMANSCFKLIDAIPDNFGRWGGLPQGFGSGIKTGMGEIGGLLTKVLAGKFIMDSVKGGKVKKAESKFTPPPSS